VEEGRAEEGGGIPVVEVTVSLEIPPAVASATAHPRPMKTSNDNFDQKKST